MKIQFNPDLDYQRVAIESIVGVFEGQETCQTNFSVPAYGRSASYQPDMLHGSDNDDLGIGNRLELLEDELLDNVRQIQLNRGLKQSKKLGSMDFTVEMETGTGKTYVYLRSIFELNQRYGFTKFIIVVPSVAIKEGVYKSLQITEQHFKEQYSNIQYDYFVYDSQKREQVRSFATNDYIQIMVINIDAFRKSFTDPDKETSANLIHRTDDRLNGMKPIEFIRYTRPIVIIDEPQSVDTTAKSKEAIASLNPLCTLRYSATHRDKYNLLYKLDSIDAYEQKLVKQIEVAHISVRDGHNKAYIKLIDTKSNKNGITAKIELDVMKSGRVRRDTITVKPNADLYELSKGRDIYQGYIINEIFCGEGQEYIDFTSKPEIIRKGELIGGVDEDEFKRLQIRKTIEEHLEKELVLIPQGIKVLSLFFIDKVANYRFYDDEGTAQQGKYAKIFEEEYVSIARRGEYRSLFGELSPEELVSQLHNGYFAIDKKTDSSGNALFKESKLSAKGEGGKTAADESAYNLIMKEKERLLSLDCKLKFLFSHSALKEGWDNPNVFQICTLNETSSVTKKRQEIGRGLRIAVNQDGERVHGFEVNTLTVMANESYEDFVASLQKEIEEEEGIRFGVVDDHLFANIVVRHEGEKPQFLGAAKSEQIWKHLLESGLIDKHGKVLDSLKLALRDSTLELPEEVQEQAAQIQAVLKKVTGGLNIKDGNKRETVKLNKAVYLGEEFKALWDKIKFKTSYQVDFDHHQLVEACAKAIEKDLVVGKTKFEYAKGTVATTRHGLEVKEGKTQSYIYDAWDYQLPDIVSYLQNATNLTRRSIVNILTRCNRLDAFRSNPQKFIDEATAIIKLVMRQFIVDGIKYQKIGDEHFYCQEMFLDRELKGYLDKNMLQSGKSVYDHVVYDSDVERDFAQSFESREEVKVYAKLPDWFKIDTPLGTYNPDWAVLVETNSEEKLFFVVETKSTLFSDALRPTEQAKIDCGREHFRALGHSVGFAKANNFESFVDQLG